MIEKILKNRIYKYIISGFGAIILGSVGSGFWEVVIKPGFNYLSEFIINNTSYIFRTINDSIYQSASKGFHEESGLNVYLLETTLFTTFTTVVILLAFGYPKMGSKKLDNIGKMIEDVKKDEAPDIKKLDEIEKLLDKHSSKLRITKRLAAFYVMAFTTFLFIQFFLVYNKNEIITNFKQNLTVIRPYIEDESYLILESQFALIKGQSDYLKLMNEIKKIAVSRKVKLPN